MTPDDTAQRARVVVVGGRNGRRGRGNGAPLLVEISVEIAAVDAEHAAKAGHTQLTTCDDAAGVADAEAHISCSFGNREIRRGRGMGFIGHRLTPETKPSRLVIQEYNDPNTSSIRPEMTQGDFRPLLSSGTMEAIRTASVARSLRRMSGNG